jgi:hypothetical protein
MRDFIQINGEDLKDREKAKIEKVINLRLLDLMNEMRDATP